MHSRSPDEHQRSRHAVPAPSSSLPSARLDGLTRRLVLAALCALLAGAVLIVVINQYSDIDRRLADLYFDATLQTFPWENTWFGRDLMHGYVKKMIIWGGLLNVAFVLVDLCRPFPRLSPLRRVQLRYLALASILEPALASSLKQVSNLHCPFAIDAYGGSQPLLRLLDAVPNGWPAGHCFPAGHASAGMWLAALAILWLPGQPRKAGAAFVGGLGFGLFMGWVQQMRGMHFLSHTLATAWLSTALLAVLLVVFWRPLQAACAAPANQPAGWLRLLAGGSRA